jgi:hypothetical protein
MFPKVITGGFVSGLTGFRVSLPGNHPFSSPCRYILQNLLTSALEVNRFLDFTILSEIGILLNLSTTCRFCNSASLGGRSWNEDRRSLTFGLVGDGGVKTESVEVGMSMFLYHTRVCLFLAVQP